MSAHLGATGLIGVFGVGGVSFRGGSYQPYEKSACRISASSLLASTSTLPGLRG